MDKHTVIEGGKVVVRKMSESKGDFQRKLAAQEATRFSYTVKLSPPPEGISRGRWWAMVKHYLRRGA